jgi:uncharacterized membrane protein
MSRLISPPETIFIVLGSIYGLIFIFLTPPFQVPDELAHFYRSFQVSEGTLIAKTQGALIGGEIPLSLITTASKLTRQNPRHPDQQDIEAILSVMSLPINKSKKAFAHFPGGAQYSPIPYLPQALALNIGNIFGLSPIMCLYLGRFSNLLIWLVLVYIGIKTIPVSKWPLLLLALTPMSLFQAGSMSVDAFTNGIVFLFIATILSYAFEATENTDHIKSSLFVLFVLSLLLTLSKSQYAPVLLLVLLVSKKRFYSSSTRITYLGLFFLLNAIVFFGWAYLAKELWASPNEPVSPHEQLLYILGNPIEYSRVLMRTFITYYQFYLHSFIGILGWLDTPLPRHVVLLYLAVLLLFSLSDNHDHICMSLNNKIVVFTALVANVLLICTALYLSWNTVGKSVLDGIQGRYFIPLSPLIALLLYNQRVNVNKYARACRVFIILFCSYVLIQSIYVLYARYYTGP